MIDEVYKYGKNILNSKGMIKSKSFIQHGSVSVYDHSINVAQLALNISKRFKNVDTKSLIRGALLHDYFLYDWHQKDKSHRLHGFTHASTALKNANRDFKLNKIEKDIIKKHMFPLNIIPPRYKESYIVCIADKICALKEIFVKKDFILYENSDIMENVVRCDCD